MEENKTNVLYPLVWKRGDLAGMSGQAEECMCS